MVLVVWLALGFSIVNHKSAVFNSRDVPLVGQPTANFYDAQGTRVKVAWAVTPTTVPEGGELTATLTVTGATNPHKIIRPDLRQLDAFQSRFVITDVTDPPPAADATEVRFTYRLRPRSRSVAVVPKLDFRFHNPTAAVGKQFPLTRSNEVEVTVTEPPPRPKPPAVPLAEPDHLFAVATGPRVLARPPAVPGPWVWVAVGLGAPLAAAGWYVAWRRVYPDASRLARIRRTKAARRATEAIRKADRTADPPATVAAAVLGYFRARFPLPPGAVTPTEVAAALAEVGMPPDACGAAAGVLRACDAARFSATGDTEVSLIPDAAALVARLEAA